MTHTTGTFRTVDVKNGVVQIEQRIRVTQSHIGTDASGPACIFARVHLKRGHLAYLQDTLPISVPKRFAIFLPPFTLVQASLEGCDVSTIGVAFRPPPASGWPPNAVLIPFDNDNIPTVPSEVIRLMAHAHNAVDIGRAREPLPMALRAKTILDTEYGSALTIAAIAKRLRTSSSVLSRSFKFTYGIPPVRYRHHLRVMDALLRFAAGAVPLDVSYDVGFDDLSRFYKILRKIACAPPGAYRPRPSRNAKT